jgi:hypothetical protein
MINRDYRLLHLLQQALLYRWTAIDVGRSAFVSARDLGSSAGSPAHRSINRTVPSWSCATVTGGNGSAPATRNPSGSWVGSTSVAARPIGPRPVRDATTTRASAWGVGDPAATPEYGTLAPTTGSPISLLAPAISPVRHRPCARSSATCCGCSDPTRPAAPSPRSATGRPLGAR